MLVFSYEFADIRFCEILVIDEAISDYVAQSFSLHGPRASVPTFLITCSSPHKASKVGDIMHPPIHLILTLGDDFTSHVNIIRILSTCSYLLSLLCIYVLVSIISNLM